MPRTRLVTITTAAGLSLGCGGLFGDNRTSNPPPPRPAATLFQDGEGVCMVHVTFDCPPPEEGMTCNPPAPEEVPCPPLSRTNQITRQDDGSCVASGRFECPSDWACPNSGTVTMDCPPQLGAADRMFKNYVYGCTSETDGVRTQTTDCPPSLDQPLSADYRIEANGDGTCTAWFTGEMHCPEGASCNPPPPEDVPCPPEPPIKTNPPPPG